MNVRSNVLAHENAASFLCVFVYIDALAYKRRGISRPALVMATEVRSTPHSSNNAHSIEMCGDIFFSLLCSIGMAYSDVFNGTVVETRAGKIGGLIDKTIFGDTFYAFKGIPYAKPAVGQLRFQVSLHDYARLNIFH